MPLLRVWPPSIPGYTRRDTYFKRIKWDNAKKPQINVAKSTKSSYTRKIVPFTQKILNGMLILEEELPIKALKPCPEQVELVLTKVTFQPETLSKH